MRAANRRQRSARMALITPSPMRSPMPSGETPPTHPIAEDHGDSGHAPEDRTRQIAGERPAGRPRRHLRRSLRDLLGRRDRPHHQIEPDREHGRDAEPRHELRRRPVPGDQRHRERGERRADQHAGVGGVPEIRGDDGRGLQIGRRVQENGPRQR